MEITGTTRLSRRQETPNGFRASFRRFFGDKVAAFQGSLGNVIGPSFPNRAKRFGPARRTPENQDRASELLSRIAVLPVVLKINRRTGPVVFRHCLQHAWLSKGSLVRFDCRRVQHTGPSGPPIQQMQEEEVRIRAHHPFRQGRRLSQKRPMESPDGDVHVRGLPTVQRWDGVQTHKVADPFRTIERKPVADPCTAVMRDHAEPVMPNFRHDANHVLGHLTLGVVDVLRIGRGSPTCSVTAEIGDNQCKRIHQQRGQPMPLNVSLRESMQQQERSASTADAAMDGGILAADIVCLKSLEHRRRSQAPMVAERG